MSQKEFEKRKRWANNWQKKQRESARKWKQKQKNKAIKKLKNNNFKRKMALRGKKSTYKRKAWKWFSRYIRARDANDDGYCECISCGDQFYWKSKKANAGHFISKSLGNRLLFDETNVNAQCVKCNVNLGGNLYEYALGLDIRYGKGTAKKLKEIKDKDGTKKYTKQDYQDIADKYKKKFEKIRKEKGLEKYK